MAKLHRLNTTRTKNVPAFFSRGEFQQLLDLYSRRVASGEWRDYAIDQHAGIATFSVFRHTHEQPLFKIAKRGPDNEFEVYSGPHRLKRTGSLREALSVLESRRRLRVVS